jgi:response regulator RpfG family c-di-GMP phosphodiesterase
VSENYDGSGKPKGLKQNEIPIGARILKIVATFVLLVANNTYRAGEKEDLTLLHMEQKKGGYFDPDLLGRFREYILERRSRIL